MNLELRAVLCEFLNTLAGQNFPPKLEKFMN